MHDLGGDRRVVDAVWRCAEILRLLGDALAAESAGFTFLQISDSHIGFNKPATNFNLPQTAWKNADMV